MQFPYFEWTHFSIGPITIQVWGMFVALGILLSLIILNKRAKRYGVDAGILLDLAFWVLVGGFIGARLGHTFLYEPAYYLLRPLEIFAIWHGGLSSFGGFVGAALGFYLFVKKKKIKTAALLSLAEQLIFAGLFGWMTARVGCMMIHDHWGIPCNCPFAIRTPDGPPRLDMALLEIIFLLPLALLFLLYRNRKVFAGFFLSIFAIYYGVLRFILDFFRATDIENADARYLGLTPGQYFAILMVVLGVYLLRKKR